jgi:hypothetical protein
MSRSRTLLTAVAAVLAGGLVPAAAAAQADDPTFVPWSSQLPPLASAGHVPSSADDCVAGRLACVDAVIRTLDRQVDRLARSCDHDVVFGLSYLRTTEEYRRATTTPGFFEDPAFVNHEDAVFARLYLDAYEAWHAGRREEVPRAWAIAFDAADERALPASGNLLLGINAHVSRDLPHTLAAIGIVAPDGTSRKRDHDAVNRFLNRVTVPLIAEIAHRFDPSVDDTALPWALDATVLFQTIASWREGAWRNAELLVSAPTPAARRLVEAEIEAQAAAQAATLRSTLAVSGLGGSAARDAWCAAHG